MKRLAASALLALVGCRPTPPAPEVATLPPIPPLEAGAPTTIAPAPPPLELLPPGSVKDGRHAVGDAAPGFDLAAIGSDKKRVAIYRGRVSLVYFWATWCAPCQKAFPEFDELYRRYSGRGFDLIALSVDDELTGVAEFARLYGATFPAAWDRDHATAEAYRVHNMPSHYLVDRGGTIRFVHHGYVPSGPDPLVEGTADKLIKEVESLL